jgi:hypothetical protein
MDHRWLAAMERGSLHHRRGPRAPHPGTKRMEAPAAASQKAGASSRKFVFERDEGGICRPTWTVTAELDPARVLLIHRLDMRVLRELRGGSDIVFDEFAEGFNVHWLRFNAELGQPFFQAGIL